MAQLWPLLIVAALFIGISYYFGVRPLRQREKQHDAMVTELQTGDTVITAGGIYGRVDSIHEEYVIIEVESGAKLRVTKGGIVKREGDYLDAGRQF